MSDVPDLTFSMDPDEEKHILYEKNEVFEYFILVYNVFIKKEKLVYSVKSCQRFNITFF